MTLPGTLFRGIRKRDFVYRDENGTSTVLSLAFEPNSNAKRDGFVETSINWDDGPGVLELTQKQSTAQEGVASLAREVVDDAMTHPSYATLLKYERREVDGNPHHGNLLFSETMKPPIIRLICSQLAMWSTFIPPLAKKGAPPAPLPPPPGS